MQYKSVAAVLAAAATVSAQSSNSNASICDRYTTALFTNNTADNQLTLLTALVNTVVIGTYRQGNLTYVPGILAPGNVNGEDVNLLPYFDGALYSSNRGRPAAVNFLDDGGAAPLMQDKPSNGNQQSNQYMLLTHLYQFFGTLLQCSQQGTGNFPSYGGQPSMGRVHQYMNLNNAENTYFITQVGLAAASFGVSTDDITTVANALNSTFNQRCAAPPTTGPLAGNTQAICQAADCTLAADADCSQYIDAVEPAIANATLAGDEGNATSTATGTGVAGGSAPSETGSSTAGAPTSTISPAAGARLGTSSAAAAAAGLALAAFLL